MDKSLFRDPIRVRSKAVRWRESHIDASPLPLRDDSIPYGQAVESCGGDPVGVQPDGHRDAAGAQFFRSALPQRSRFVMDVRAGHDRRYAKVAKPHA